MEQFIWLILPYGSQLLKEVRHKFKQGRNLTRWSQKVWKIVVY